MEELRRGRLEGSRRGRVEELWRGRIEGSRGQGFDIRSQQERLDRVEMTQDNLSAAAQVESRDRLESGVEELR